MQPLLEPLQVVRSRPITRAESKLLSALVEPEVSQLRFAERGRTLENRFEHGSDVRRRTRDNAQNLAGRGLLIECLGERAVLLLQLREEPDVFDGDDRLVGEGLQEIYLFFREWLNLCASERHHPDCDALAQYRNAHDTAVAELPGECAAFGKLVHLSLEVRHVDR